MRNHREQKIRLGAALFIAIAGASGPALGEQTRWIRCSETAVLGAWGNLGKHSYRLRGRCKVYAHAHDIGKQVFGVPVPDGLDDKGPYLDSREHSKVVGEFIALADVEWNGNTGETGEALVIDGQKLSTQMNCIKDPFIGSSCSGAKVSAGVDQEILTAILKSQQPVFAGTVRESLAEVLFKQKDKGGPPPPPAPKITLDIAVSGLSVHQVTNGGPHKKKGAKSGSAGIEYKLSCGFTPHGSTGAGSPKTSTRFVFKANGVVVRDVYAPVEPNKSISMGAKWKPTSLGTYSLTCEANPDHKLEETSYANNQKAMSFPVKKFAVQLGAIPSTSPPPAIQRRRRDEGARRLLLVTPTPTPAARRPG
jgi:hypothetical protein